MPKTKATKPVKQELREFTDRAVKMADRQFGVYSVDPNAAPNASLNPPRNVGSVEPGTPIEAEKVPMIPSATYDPVRAEGNWAPYRPVPEPVPGLVPGYRPGQPIIGDAQWGGTGTPITAGFLIDLGEYNPEVYGRAAVLQYEKMRRGDAQVWATLGALKSPLRSARWDVRPGVAPNEPGFAQAKEVSDFVKDNIFGGLEFQTSTGGMTSQSWEEVLWNALLMLDFGCAVHEDVFRVDGNYLKLRALVPLLPITYYRWHTEADGHTLIGLEQYGYRGIEFINATVPAEKICRFTAHQEGSNFWGIAISRPCFPHWYIKNQLYRIDAIASERNGLGVPTLTLAEGASAQDVATAYNFVTKLSAHEMTGLVLPNGATFKIEGVTGTPRDMMKSIEHHNRMISTAAMAMFMTIGSAPHGSRATAATQHDFFLSATQFLSNYVAERLRQTTIRRLVRINFGENASIPKIQAMNLKMRDFEDVRQSLQQLAAQGLVVSDGPLRAYIRDQYELPEETDEDVLITKKGEAIEKDPVVSGPAAAANAAPVGQQPAAQPANQQPNQPQMDQPKGSPQHQPQYKHPVKPAPKTPVKPVVNDVVTASDSPFGRMDGVIQAPDPKDVQLSETMQPTIYFVRHGETPDDVDPNAETISSWSNVMLTPKGRSEAAATAKMLGGKGVAEIYSSDLDRTMQTAEAISKKIGVKVTPERGLRGWNVGAYTGMSANTKLKNGRTISEQLTWLEQHPNIKPPGGDSWRETDARLNDAILHCVQRAEMLGKPIVVVTHSRVINALPTLSRGAIPQAVSEKKGIELGRIAKAVKDSNDGNWSIQFNATQLSDAGYHSIGDDLPIPVPNNRSGQPTQRSTPDTAPKGPPMDEAQEQRPSYDTSPSFGGYSPNDVPGQKNPRKPNKVTDVTAQQAQQGARIVSGGQIMEANTSFKPSTTQERQVSPVPEDMQPSDKQDTPLEPTPDPYPPPPETFDEDDEPEVLTEVKKKPTHYEDIHGATQARKLRQTYQGHFERLLKELTGPIKARIIGSIARQAAKQLKAKVSPAQMVFTLEPHLETLLDNLLTEIHQQAVDQITGEHNG